MLRATYPLASICRVLGLPHSTLYYRAQPRDDQEVRQAIEAVAQQFPTYGSRRIAAQVRRAPYRLLVNRKRAQRVMRNMGLLRRTRPRQQRTTDSRHGFRRFPNLVADRAASEPDEIWVSDITYVRLGAGFIYLAIIMDVFTRDIRGWQLGRTLDQALTLTALQRALAHHTPVLHHSDQGIQYAAPEYIKPCRRRGSKSVWRRSANHDRTAMPSA
jgi:putative transposase